MTREDCQIGRERRRREGHTRGGVEGVREWREGRWRGRKEGGQSPPLSILSSVSFSAWRPFIESCREVYRSHSPSFTLYNMMLMSSTKRCISVSPFVS